MFAERVVMANLLNKHVIKNQIKSNLFAQIYHRST